MFVLPEVELRTVQMNDQTNDCGATTEMLKMVTWYFAKTQKANMCGSTSNVLELEQHQKDTVFFVQTVEQ